MINDKKLEIGIVKDTDQGLIVEARFFGSYEQGNTLALRAMCNELETIIQEQNASAIILNLLNFDYIYGDDLQALIETAIRIKGSRKIRSYALVAESRKVVTPALENIEEALKYLEKELVERLNEPKEEPPIYFPEHVLSMREFMMSGFLSSELWMMREPSFLDYIKNHSLCYHGYRCLIHPPFGGLTCLRLEVSSDGSGFLIKKAPEDKALGPWNSATKLWPLAIHETKDISPQDIGTFLKHLDKADFWHEPTIRMHDFQVLDDISWILEGAKEQRYHVVQRDSETAGFLGSAISFLSRLGCSSR